jgi:hypothetical protein
MLREECEHDAAEAGVAMPPLPEPPQFADARELRVLGNLLSGTANAEVGLMSGPLTARGKAAQRKKWEESSYASGNGQTAGVMRE